VRLDSRPRRGQDGRMDARTEEAIAGDRIIERARAWGLAQEDCRAILLLGSRARQIMPADQYSNYDFVFFMDNFESYKADASWLNAIIEPALFFTEDAPWWKGFEYRLLGAEGQDLDAIIVPAAVGLCPELAKVAETAHAIILDKDGILSGLARAGTAPEEKPITQPDARAVMNACRDFLFHIVWAAKKALRGELLTAKNCVDNYLKSILCELEKTRAAMGGGPIAIPHHDTRFLEKWARPEFVSGLKTAFCAYEAADILGRLDANIKLFEMTAMPLCQGQPGAQEALRADIATTRGILSRLLDGTKTDHGAVIRRALLQDCPRMAELHVMSWRHAYGHFIKHDFLHDPSALRRREEAFSKAVREDSEETYVYEEGGLIKGILTIGDCRDADKGPQAFELWGIYLDPGSIGRGIGRRLAEFCEAQARARGRSEIVLWTFEKNAAARAFYEHLGFKPDGARKTIDFFGEYEMRYAKRL